MSKTFQALNAQAVKSILKAGVPGRHCDGEGLWLFVSSQRSASWIFRYQRAGKQHDMGIGAASVLSLSDARELAREARKVMALGGDPMQSRRDQAAQKLLVASRQITFKQAADEFIATSESNWANPKHRQQWRNTLTSYVHPEIGHMSIQDVDVDTVKKVLAPIWNSKPETARRVRARIEMILDAAEADGRRQGENPAAWNGRLERILGKRGKKLATVKNHPSLPFEEMPDFLRALRQQAGIAAMALEFTILTAARTSEVLGLGWSEINRTSAVWTVPGARMKSGRQHLVALSSAALAVLDQIPTKEGVAFRAGSLKPALSNAAMAAVLARMGRSDVTVHGMRASFRTWVQEVHPADGPTAEAALAHAIGDKTEAAYVRVGVTKVPERRVTLMQAWAEFCMGASTSAEATPLREAG